MIFHISEAQYIHAIHDYKPAPGQFINSPGGNMESAVGIIGHEGGLISLGAFGGYIVFSFEHAVENDNENPYGIDFVIFGNPTQHFSEPGIVSVMLDENDNGVPDDHWFELAGSDYSLNTTFQNYTIQYNNPNTDGAADVFWEDNFNNSGKISANSFHTQSYYPGEGFNAEFYGESCRFSGTKIEAETDFSDPFMIKSLPRAYGYADNIQAIGVITDLPDNPYTPEIEGMGGDAMDISWAVDSLGNKVFLDRIHFVRVHTAVLGEAGPLGEFSTEIRSALDISPAPGFPNDLVSFDSEELLSVFPNPFMNEIHIKGINKANIECLSPQGHILFKSEISRNHTINTEKLLPGIYFLKIYNSKETKLFTLIKAAY